MDKAVILDNWEDVNSYFEQGWEYVDSKITDEKGKKTYHFILKEGDGKPVNVIVKRNRK